MNEELKACPLSIEDKVMLWDAINRYAVACGGDTGGKTISADREDAVAECERAFKLISNRRATPENPLTPEQLRQMDGESVYFTWDSIGWSKVVVIDGFPRVAACVNQGNGYECHLYTPTDIDGNSYAYARKPEGEKKS